MNVNKSATRYSVHIVSPRGKVEERGTRCTNQETAHRVARDIARDASYTKVRRVELVDPSGEVVERFTISKDGNHLEVLNGKSVQAVRRAQREAAATPEKGRKLGVAVRTVVAA